MIRARLFLIAIAVASLPIAAQAGGSAPKGFSLKNGALIRWGDSCKQAQARAGRLSDSAEGEDSTYAAVTCEDNIVAADATPPPYHAAQLYFNAKGQLYAVAAWLKPEDFAEARQPLIASLGPPNEEESIVQNGFGATFDKTTDRWQVGSVSVLLENRAKTVDEAILTMIYLPLAPKPTKKSVKPPF